jgi:hypothetical protein
VRSGLDGAREEARRVVKVAVMGTGAMGGYLGARLGTAPGVCVTFIARGAHLAAIRTTGLRVWSPLGDVHVTPASATDDPAAVGPVDVVLLGVKLYDIKVAVKALGPLLGADTAVVWCSDADGYETLAEVLAWAGRPEESIKFIRQAMRLNPHYPFFYLWTLGHASYLARRTDDAVDAFSKAVQQNPNFLPAHAYLAVLFVEAGREREAREKWERLNRLSPKASLASLQERLPYRRAADLDRFLTAAHKAGMR